MAHNFSLQIGRKSISLMFTILFEAKTWERSRPKNWKYDLRIFFFKSVNTFPRDVCQYLTHSLEVSKYCLPCSISSSTQQCLQNNNLVQKRDFWYCLSVETSYSKSGRKLSIIFLWSYKACCCVGIICKI